MWNFFRLNLVALVLVTCHVPPVRSDELPETWAYERFSRPTVPQVSKSGQTFTHPIDRFLLARLSTTGLTFAPEADRRTLIRRLYFDLIGLPPTPEDIDAFLTDESPVAYEKLVDRLLESPQFGERMAIWWFDLVRFAETDGFKADDPRPTAWRYRDYVIKSFNQDKPFDQFIREQLAGDELDWENKDALIATGFLRLYPYEYNAVDVELKRQDMLNDITETTATVFLGLTLGCARCHDHKTDPISQRDYYRFQAFFAGFWPIEAPLLSASELAALDQQHSLWEAKTAALRGEMARLEQPVRAKAMAKERGRFPAEYAGLLDIPEHQRTPLQKQLAALVEKQVYSRYKVTAAQMPAADRPRWEELAKQLAELEKDRPGDPPTAMAMSDLATPPATRVLKRGSWRQPGEEVAPGFLSKVDKADPVVTPRQASSGRRLALANWIAAKENPLTARVIVNRLWQHHFGTGIVATPSDFGVTGDRPTHPELLNWLASELVNPSPPQPDSGQLPPAWSLKHIHRLIVTSHAYRQSSQGDAKGLKVDPHNKLLWCYPRRRLDGEALRDAMLAVSGQLNLKAGGPSIFPELPAELKSPQWKVTSDRTERNRRSVYVFVKRNLRYPIFALFDAPDRNETCSRRHITTTAPQALALLNDPVVIGFANDFANRVIREAGTDPSDIIKRAYILALGRTPTSTELDTVIAFLKKHQGTHAQAIADLCHALFNLNEFLYID
jgi:hypothetical protein